MACHFYFVSPSKVSSNTARIRASKKRILFKRRHLSSPVYFRKRSLLLHILRSVIKIAIGLRKGLTDRRNWQRQCREIVLHLSEHASTLITLLSAVGAIKSQTICIPGVAGYLHGNKSPWRYCRSSLSSYCCLFGVTCCTVFPSHGSYISPTLGTCFQKHTLPGISSLASLSMGEKNYLVQLLSCFNQSKDCVTNIIRLREAATVGINKRRGRSNKEEGWAPLLHPQICCWWGVGV